MIFDLFFMMMAFYLAIPFVAGYTAKSYGRPFWPWFVFGCFLPAFAHLVLYFKIKNDIRRNKVESLLTDGEINYMDNQIDGLLHENEIAKTVSQNQKKKYNLN